MTSFRTLDLAHKYYHFVEKLEMPRHLKEQLLRSSSSVALNLAEGNVKRSAKDKQRVFEIALGSFRESQTIIKLAGVEPAELLKLEDHLGACIYKLTFKGSSSDGKATSLR